MKKFGNKLHAKALSTLAVVLVVATLMSMLAVSLSAQETSLYSLYTIVSVGDNLYNNKTATTGSTLVQLGRYENTFQINNTSKTMNYTSQTIAMYSVICPSYNMTGTAQCWVSAYDGQYYNIFLSKNASSPSYSINGGEEVYITSDSGVDISNSFPYMLH